jgi:hypothetical protein
MPEALQYHYTNKDGYDGIRSAKVWRFIADKPPCEHPKGAYFTDLDEQTPLLAKRLRIGKLKIEYVFKFLDVGDLQPLEGDRGQHIFYSKTDYFVEAPRQRGKGERES